MSSIAPQQPNATSQLQSRGRVMMLGALMAAIIVIALIAFYAMQPPKAVHLRISAGPNGSDSHTLLTEIAAVAQRVKAPLVLDIIASKDSSESISALNSNNVDLAAIRGDAPVVSDVQLVTTLFSDKFQLIARGDSGIRTIADLNGKRLILPPSGSDGLRSFFVIVDHYDLDISSISWRAMSLEEGAPKLLSNQADAIFTVRSLRDQSLIKLVEDAQLKSVILDHIAINQGGAIVLKRPQLSPSFIPEGAIGGATPVPARDTPTLAVNRVLVARSDVDRAAIRALTAVMFENRLELTTRFSLAAAIERPDLTGGLNMPLHEGASAYYNRDQPSFVQENAEPLALGLTVLAMIFSGFLALRSRFGASQKNRADVYNYRLIELNASALAAQSRAELIATREELAEIMATVITALDTDEVTDAGFHSFARVHESVSATVRDRLTELAA